MTVIDTALHASLRTLKLSGMLETLDARLAQARAGELGHLDVLQVLCQAEVTRRRTSSNTVLRRPVSQLPTTHSRWRAVVSQRSRPPSTAFRRLSRVRTPMLPGPRTSADVVYRVTTVGLKVTSIGGRR